MKEHGEEKKYTATSRNETKIEAPKLDGKCVGESRPAGAPGGRSDGPEAPFFLERPCCTGELPVENADNAPDERDEFCCTGESTFCLLLLLLLPPSTPAPPPLPPAEAAKG